MKLGELSTNHQRAILRLVLCNPYLRGGKTFAGAVKRILGEHVPEDVARRLRYEVYEVAGLAPEGQGYTSLLVTDKEKLLAAAVRAWDDRRLKIARRTANIGVRPGGTLAFLGGPNDKAASYFVWVAVTPEGEPVWTTGPEEDAEDDDYAPRPTLEPEEVPQEDPQEAAEDDAEVYAPQEADKPQGTVLATVDALMPLLICAMRDAGYDSLLVCDGDFPTYSFAGKTRVTL